MSLGLFTAIVEFTGGFLTGLLIAWLSPKFDRLLDRWIERRSRH